MEAKHTATPWSRDKYGHVADASGQEVRFRSLTCLASGSRDSVEEAEANTDLLVDACNAHDHLVKALTKIADGEVMSHDSPFTHLDTVLAYQEIARAALAKAGA
jgi:hypothetical protein